MNATATSSATTAEHDIYMANYSTPGPGFNGLVTVTDFLDGLLDLPMASKYLITMQEGKGFPVAIETRHELLIQSGEGFSSKEILRTSATSREDFELNQLQEARSSKLPIWERGTVRSLIHGLMGLNPDDLITIGGHFYSGFYFKTYPTKAAMEKLQAKIDAELAAQFAKDFDGDDALNEKLPQIAPTQGLFGRLRSALAGH